MINIVVLLQWPLLEEYPVVPLWLEGMKGEVGVVNHDVFIVIASLLMSLFPVSEWVVVMCYFLVVWV